MRSEYTEQNARRLLNLFEQRVEALGVLVHGPVINGEGRKSTLDQMLAAGGFPETQSLALKNAFDALQDAVADLEMELLVPFEMARDEGAFYNDGNNS